MLRENAWGFGGVDGLGLVVVAGWVEGLELGCQGLG